MDVQPTTDPRTKHLAFFMTPEDAIRLREAAPFLGFRTHGKLVTAICEALLAGGFSPLSFMLLGFQIQKHQEKHGKRKDPKKPIQERFWFGRPALPILDPNFTLSPDDVETYKAALQAELDNLNAAPKPKN
jgi:hypothetical protein